MTVNGPPVDRTGCESTGTKSARPTSGPEAVPAKPEAGAFPRGGRAVAVMFSQYPSDPRPRRAAEALAQAGMSVEVICLAGETERLRRDAYHGVDITRLPLKRRRGGKLGYLWQYGSFVLMVFFILAWRSLFRRYSLVHVHNMPDFLVFSALGPKLRGARVILDLHDPMPELMRAIFGLDAGSRTVSLLQLVEKWSIRFSDQVLTVNEACKKIFSGRSCSAAKIGVIMNAPDEAIFRFYPVADRVAAWDDSKPFVLMYHGSLVERHGLDLAVNALQIVRGRIPGIQLRVYGQKTPFLDQVMTSVRASGLDSIVHYHGPKSLDEIADAIRQCDVGVIPNRRSIFTEINTPTRIFEYLSQGKPVIAPRAPGITDYFPDGTLTTFELGNTEDLAAKIEHVFRNPSEVAAQVRSGQEVYLAHRWVDERARFVSLVSELLEGRRSGGGRAEGVRRAAGAAGSAG